MTIQYPSDIPNLSLWVGAGLEDITTDNTSITGLTDYSGLDNHPVKAGGGEIKWRSTAGILSTPALEFTGATSSQHLIIPSAVYSGCTEVEVFINFKVKTNNSGRSLWSPADNGAHAHHPYSDGNVYETFFCNHQRSYVPTVALTSWRRYNLWSKANDWSVRLDETTQSTQTTSTFKLPTNFLVGTGYTPLDGYISTMLFYRRKLTTDERTDVSNWLVNNPSGGVKPPRPLVGSWGAF